MQTFKQQDHHQERYNTSMPGTYSEPKLLKLKKCKLPTLLICHIVLFLPIAASAQSDALVGHWEGAYVRLGAVQTISVDFFVEGNTLRGKYDIPDLSIYDELIRDLEVDFPRLKLRPKHGLFDMIVDISNEEMTGTNSRWNPPVTLHLKRTQKAPVKFTSEDVVFANGNLKLAGRLFKPLKPGRYPAAVVVHGSGPQGISDNYYNFWGRFFASRGVAALIYDNAGLADRPAITSRLILKILQAMHWLPLGFSGLEKT